MLLQAFRHQASKSLFTLSGTIPKKVTTCRFIHLAPGGKCIPIKATFKHDLYKRTTFLATVSIRNNSTTLQPEALATLPDPPTPVTDVLQGLIEYNANGDPTFSSIGLGGYSPVGLIRYFLEAIHVYTGMPWWGTIVTASVILKLVLIKVYINGQRVQVLSQNHAPQLQALQKRMMEEQMVGNLAEAALLMKEQQHYMKTHGISPFKTMATGLIQGSVSFCTFFAIRGMLLSDLESLRHGGYWWFLDLTAPDPLYLLPVATTASIAILTETMMINNFPAGGVLRYVFRAIPLISFPIMMQFGSGLQLFWLTTNIVTLAQMGLFKLPQVQKVFNIPERTNPTVDGFNISQDVQKWQEMRQLKQDSKKVGKYKDHLTFAARSPFVKTFKHNPKAQDKEQS